MHLFAANMQCKSSSPYNKQKCDQEFLSTQHRYQSTSPPLPLVHTLGDIVINRLMHPYETTCLSESKQNGHRTRIISTECFSTEIKGMTCQDPH